MMFFVLIQRNFFYVQTPKINLLEFFELKTGK